MTRARYTFAVIASCVTAITGQTKTSDSDLQPKVAVENQKLLTGDSPPVVLGEVKARAKGDNLEMVLALSRDGCFIESSHLCNIPSQTYTASDGATQVPYSIPLFDVYEFVCMYESDFFVIAGHAQVRCKGDPGGVNKEGATLPPTPPSSYEAYYEIPVECDQAQTTAPPLITKSQLWTKQPLETLATKQQLETLKPLATKQQLITKQALESEQKLPPREDPRDEIPTDLP